MSYTPPVGSAVNVSFSASGGYTPPAGGAVNIDFNVNIVTTILWRMFLAM